MVIATLTHSGESLWNRQTTRENRLVAFGGGCPLEVDGETVGTVSVGGGEVVQGVAVAEADIERFDEPAERQS